MSAEAMVRAAPGPTAPDRAVRAWDAPTRLFKWSLVALVTLSWVSHRYGDVTLTWHKLNGYAILILIVFRVLWGFVGSSTARFSAWVSSPWRAVSYGVGILKGKRRPYLSHNPLGAWMIIILLVFIAGEGVAGLFTVESNGIFGGPFANTDPLSDSTPVQRQLSCFHHQAFNILLALVAVHVAVNLFYQFVKRDPIVAAMITGRKPLEDFADQAEMDAPRNLWMRAVLCLAAASALVLGTIKLFGGKLL